LPAIRDFMPRFGRRRSDPAVPRPWPSALAEHTGACCSPRNPRTDWEIIGVDEPYYGVLAQERFLRRNLNRKILDEFWKTGEDDIAYVCAVINRVIVSPFQPARALDFGCGVGRQTRAMARVATEVIGFDPSPGMLAEARHHATSNLRYTETLPDGLFDWINSTIVFQHIPPSEGYSVFGELIGRLAPGGVFSIQVTIFRDHRVIGAGIARARAACWDGQTVRVALLEPHAAGEMQMYDYELNRLLVSAVQHGVRACYLDHTDHGGFHGVFMFGRVEAPEAGTSSKVR
jgi:SAM-dependent methyltransferase